MFACLFSYMNICMYLYSIYVHMYICSHVYMFTCMFTCIYVHMYICSHVYMFVNIEPCRQERTYIGIVWCLIYWNVKYILYYLSIQTEQTSNVALLLGVVGGVVIYIVWTIMVVLVVGKRRSTGNYLLYLLIDKGLTILMEAVYWRRTHIWDLL